MSITPKGIHAVYSRPEDKSLRPVLQLLSVSMLAGQPGRYKIILSDGEHFTTGLLSSQLISKLGGCPFKQFQLISLDEYAVNVVQDKLFLLVHGATEITPPLPTGQIGNPKLIVRVLRLHRSRRFRWQPYKHHSPCINRTPRRTRTLMRLGRRP